MFVMGWILLPVFALWDLRYAKRPVIARRFLANKTVVCAAWIGFFDFVRISSSLIVTDANNLAAVILSDLHVPVIFCASNQTLVCIHTKRSNTEYSFCAGP